MTRRRLLLISRPAVMQQRWIFSARQHYAERAICCRLSVRLSGPSVRPSHGWISRKRLNLESCNFHYTLVAPFVFITLKQNSSIYFIRIRVILCAYRLLKFLTFNSRVFHGSTPADLCRYFRSCIFSRPVFIPSNKSVSNALIYMHDHKSDALTTTPPRHLLDHPVHQLRRRVRRRGCWPLYIVCWTN